MNIDPSHTDSTVSVVVPGKIRGSHLVQFLVGIPSGTSDGRPCPCQFRTGNVFHSFRQCATSVSHYRCTVACILKTYSYERYILTSFRWMARKSLSSSAFSGIRCAEGTLSGPATCRKRLLPSHTRTWRDLHVTAISAKYMFNIHESSIIHMLLGETLIGLERRVLLFCSSFFVSSCPSCPSPICPWT